MKAKIVRVWIEKAVDESPDTSWLGEYSDEPGEWAIVAIGEHAGEFLQDIPEGEYPERGRTLRFFNPVYQNYKGSEESDIRRWCKADFDRMESLNNGQWCFIGIIAKSEIQSGNGVIQTLRSGGLWGVESDCGPEYLKDVTGQELSGLRAELEAFGFGKRAIAYAFRNVEEVIA